MRTRCARVLASRCKLRKLVDYQAARSTSNISAQSIANSLATKRARKLSNGHFDFSPLHFGLGRVPQGIWPNRAGLAFIRRLSDDLEGDALERQLAAQS